MGDSYGEILLLARETILNQTKVIDSQDAEIARLKKEIKALESLLITDTAASTSSESSVTNGRGIWPLSPANKDAVGRLLREIAGHK